MKASLFLLCFLQIVVVSIADHDKFIGITVVNQTPHHLAISRLDLDWGKWYDCDAGKFTPVSNLSQVIKPNELVQVCASGVYGTWTGTEGRFEIREADWHYNHRLLFEIYFNVPLFGPNRLRVTQITVLPEQKAYNFSLVVSDMTTSLSNSVYATLGITHKGVEND